MSLAKQGKYPFIRFLVVVSGDEDTQCPMATAWEFVQALRGDARLVVVPGKGHGLDEATLSKVLENYFSEMSENPGLP
jgi:hypothetical protein